MTALAQALDSEQGHTSFGKLPLSVEKTAGCYSFPAAKRDDQAKVFIQDLTKTENIGKLGPGPQYAYEDKIKYKDVSLLARLSISLNFVTSRKFRHQNMLSGLLEGWSKKSPSMISMKMLCFWMIPFKLTTIESHAPVPLRLEQNQE